MSSRERAAVVALNPESKPGCLVLAGSSAVRDSVGSQVACKLGIEHFVEGVLDFFKDRDSAHSDDSQPNRELSVKVLEAAYRRANRSVYEFGHKLSAGGRMSASLLGVVIEDDVVVAGRVGLGGAYLFRNKELYPFFDQSALQKRPKSELGVNSLVAVELASIRAAESDIIVLFSCELSPLEEDNLKSCLVNKRDFSDSLSAELAQSVCEDSSGARL